MVRHYPAIMDFPGYCPWEPPKTWGERLNLYRTHMGLSLKKFAQQLGVDPGTLVREMKKKEPSEYIQKRVTEFGIKQFNR